jgi:2-dehydropantoate 2-reductase
MRLLQAGHDVSFLLRGDYKAALSSGLQLISQQYGDFTIPPDSPRLLHSTVGLQPVDWLVLGLKAYVLQHARQLAGPALGPNTRVLAITNGLVDDELSSTFPKRQEQKEM